MRRAHALTSFVLLLACSADNAGTRDAGTARDAADASDAEVPIEAAVIDASSGGMFEPPPPPLMEPTTGFVDPCALGSTIGSGVMSGALEGETPVMVRRATLDRFPSTVPSSLKSMTLPVPTRLERYASGLIASSDHGFFDVGPSGAGPFQLMRSVAAPSVHAGDLDGDGDDDVVALGLRQIGEDEEAGRALLVAFIVLFERGADGQLRQRARFDAEQRAVLTAFAIADHDGDGDEDVLTVDEIGMPFAFRNDGDFDFTVVASDAGEASGAERFIATSVTAEDRNADGAIDLVVFGWLGAISEAHVHLNDGSGELAAPSLSSYAMAASFLHAVGDVTGDGLSDIVWFGDGELLYVAKALNAGSFADAMALPPRTQGLTLGDVDGDGVLDVVSYSFQGVRVYRAVGDGFEQHAAFDVPAQWLKAIAIESATADAPAQLHALYHADCRQPCGASCTQQCIFEACIECIAHSDCEEGKSCVSGSCTPRVGSPGD